MKKIFAIMFSIVMMTVCGNEVKAQTNDAQQNYEVSGSLTSSSHKKLNKTYNVELYSLSNGVSDYVSYEKVRGKDEFKFNLRGEGAYRVKVTDSEGKVIVARVFTIDQAHPSLEIGEYDVATGKRVPVSALQANKDK